MIKGDVQAIFFDAGYTLLCMEPDQETNFLQACAELGIAVDRSRLAEGIAYANALLIPRDPELATLQHLQEAVDSFWTDYNRALLSVCAVSPGAAECAGAVYRRFTDQLGWRVYDEVRPVLAALKGRGMTLGVISNWTGDLEEVLTQVGLSWAFDFVLDSALLGFEKPHAPIFREALRRAGVSAPRALHVGDSPEFDVDGALALGLQAALLDRQGRYPDFDRAPRLQSLDDLLSLVTPRPM